MSFTLGGRRGGARGPRPTNSGQAPRTQARIDSIVESAAAQRSTAIQVDGDPALIWRRVSGSRVCSCSAQPENNPARLNDGSSGLDNGVPPNSPSNTTWANEAHSGLTSFDDYRPADAPKNPFANDLEPEFDPEFDRTEVEEMTGAASGYLDRVIERGAYQTGALTKCPICCGTGYIDGWAPSRGLRMLGDFGPSADFSLDGADLALDARPNILRLQAGGSVTWRLKIPRYLDSVLRVQVWHNTDPVELVPEIDVGTPRGQAANWVTLTPKSLLQLNGISGICSVRVRSPVSRRLTHLEIIALLAPPAKVQVPIVNMPYDPEFIDYNTVSTFELAAEDEVKQGDLIAESKYGRIWRITGLSRSSTSRGVVWGASAEVRAMQPDEIYWVLSPFAARDELI